jgi:hypothetical protein
MTTNARAKHRDDSVPRITTRRASQAQPCDRLVGTQDGIFRDRLRRVCGTSRVDAPGTPVTLKLGPRYGCAAHELVAEHYEPDARVRVVLEDDHYAWARRRGEQ